MGSRKVARWWRNLTCRHPHLFVNASTGIEAAGYPHTGNATLGVTVRCSECDFVGCTDVVAAISDDALARLSRAGRKGERK